MRYGARGEVVALGLEHARGRMLGRVLLAKARLLHQGGAEAAPEIERSLDLAAEHIEASGRSTGYGPELLEERAALRRLLGDLEGWREQLCLAERQYREIGADGRADRVARELSRVGARERASGRRALPAVARHL